MQTTVDLNADLGESFGDWTLGDDAALLDLISSANIACGMHAGDWDVMAKTMARAVQGGIGIGAHPGYPDLQGFGRRRMDMGRDSTANLVRYQVGAALGMARAAGGTLRHLKLHGALANTAAENEDLARACYEAALSVAPDLIIMVLAGTAQEQAARALGCPTACEIFADRAYNDDATLVDRRHPGAVLHDPEAITARILAMLRDGAIHSVSGKTIPTRIDTICLHGDTEGAVSIARHLRAELDGAGIAIRPFKGAPLALK